MVGAGCAALGVRHRDLYPGEAMIGSRISRLPRAAYFGKLLGDLFVAAHQGGAGALPDQADARPQAGRDLQVSGVAAVQRGHPGPADRLHRGEPRLGGRDPGRVHAVE